MNVIPLIKPVPGIRKEAEALSKAALSIRTNLHCDSITDNVGERLDDLEKLGAAFFALSRELIEDASNHGVPDLSDMIEDEQDSFNGLLEYLKQDYNDALERDGRELVE